MQSSTKIYSKTLVINFEGWSVSNYTRK